MDVSEAVAVLAGAGVALGLLGAAKLAPLAISVGWKWAKGALFG